jgi:hypothetical protein
MRIPFIGTILFLFLSAAAMAQIAVPTTVDLEPQSDFIKVSGSYHIGQNALSFNELWDTWNDDFLDVDEKNQLMGSTRDQNRLGNTILGGLTYGFSDSLGRKHAVGITHQRRLDATFTRETLYLLLFGNSEFTDQWYDLGKTTFDQMHFSSVYYRRTFDLGNHQLQLGVQLNMGHRAYRFNASQLELYTAPDGEYLDLYGDFNISLSDTANPNGINGFGAGINGQWNYHNPDSKYSYEFGFNGLGAIRWSANSYRASINDTIRFVGVQVDNLLQPDDAFDNLLDSLNSQYVGGTEESFWLMTPVFLHGQITRKLEGRIDYLYLRGDYIAFSSSLPRATIGLSFTTGANHRWFVEGSSPAYDRYGLNLGYQFQNEDWTIQARLQQLSTFALPNLGYGAGGFVSICKNL